MKDQEEKKSEFRTFCKENNYSFFSEEQLVMGEKLYNDNSKYEVVADNLLLVELLEKNKKVTLQTQKLIEELDKKKNSI